MTSSLRDRSSGVGAQRLASNFQPMRLGRVSDPLPVVRGQEPAISYRAFPPRRVFASLPFGPMPDAFSDPCPLTPDPCELLYARCPLPSDSWLLSSDSLLLTPAFWIPTPDPLLSATHY